MEIITDALDGKIPSQEELYYALLIYESMFIIDHRNLINELTTEKETNALLKKMKAEASYDMYKKALDANPKEYLGWNNDPANSEYQKEEN